MGSSDTHGRRPRTRGPGTRSPAPAPRARIIPQRDPEKIFDDLGHGVACANSVCARAPQFPHLGDLGSITRGGRGREDATPVNSRWRLRLLHIASSPPATIPLVPPAPPRRPFGLSFNGSHSGDVDSGTHPERDGPSGGDQCRRRRDPPRPWPGRSPAANRIVNRSAR